MAGERKGKALEALTYLAFDPPAKSGPLVGLTVHWNVRPKAMSIEPDLTFGKDPEAPIAALLISHSDSAKESEKKMWRNLGELLEMKTLLPEVPRVCCLTVGNIKEDLAPLQHVAFDGFLWIADRPLRRNAENQAYHIAPAWYRKLDQALEEIATQAGPGDDALIEFVSTRRSTCYQWAIDQIRTVVVAMMGSESVLARRVWALHRARPIPPPRSSQVTSFRRAIGKLVCMPAEFHTAIRLGSSFAVPDPAIATLACDLGVAEKTISKETCMMKVVDPDVVWTLRSIDKKDIAQVIASSPLKEMARAIDPIRALVALPEMVDWIEKHANDLTKPELLFRHLKACKEMPAKIAPKKLPADLEWVWLYHLVIELIRIASGKRTGFGNAALIRELDRLRGDNDHLREALRISGGPVLPRNGETIRLGLQDWYAQASKQAFALTDGDLARVSIVLSEQLSIRPLPTGSKLMAEMKSALLQSGVEVKLLTTWYFQPLEYLCRVFLERNGLTLSRKELEATWFSEAAGTRWALDPRSGRTSVHYVKRTLIEWQSCTDDGRDHKKKELVGRILGLRYTAKDNVCRQRDDYKKYVLVLDGTWRDADIKTLLQAGWDDVFYPDEIHRLAEAIV